MIEWIKANKEWLVPILGMIVFILLLSLLGLYFQKSNAEKKETQKKPSGMTVYEKVDIDVNQNGTNPSDDPKSTVETTAFFLKPTATELIKTISDLGPIELDAKASEFPGLRVMWPLYFFQITEQKGKLATIILDVGEDGFGVQVVCEVDFYKYPEILSSKPSEVIWVAGEITGINAEGTGQVLLEVEQVRFGGTVETPPSGPTYKSANAE